MLSNLLFDRKVRILEDTNVYLNYYYKLENEAAALLLDIDYNLSEANQDTDIKDVEKTLDTIGVSLDEIQTQAVLEASSHGVFVLTGGPGTGKTTTIKGLIKYFESEGLEVVLAAPTGRAAKRMSEATGFEAKTIHRLLEVHGLAGGDEDDEITTHEGIFDRNKDNPLECDVVIVDEMSMVDSFLFYSLLSAVAYGTRLILVGDINQLPSVGAGNVLKDVICSDCFPVTTLDKIYRQEEGSDIVFNAHHINKGEHLTIDNKSNGATYNLSGQQVGKDFKGVVIKDGKKIVNK
jgi:exodeoxyribonuclease V alpha subunit